MAIPTQEEMMLTLVFGTGALIIGLYYTIFSYAAGFKEVYGYSQSKTIYEVVAKTLMVHIALITFTVLFINTFEMMTGLDIYGAIRRMLTYNWFALVLQIPQGQDDVAAISVVLGYIKMITVLILALAPVGIFFGIVTKQFSECVRMSKQGGVSKGTIGCAFDILIPAIFFLTVYFIHLTFASVLMDGADGNNPDHDFLRQIGINWWRQVVTLN